MNFWDYFITGIEGMVGAFSSVFPFHTPVGMADALDGFFQTGFALTLVWLLTFIDLGVPVTILGLITALELVRATYAVYMWIKELIPIT